MSKRVHSPSAINTFKQCPRKYYYSYILRLPSAPNIHQLRGTIIHNALESFFDLTPEQLQLYDSKPAAEIQLFLKNHLLDLFTKEWAKEKKNIDALPLEKPQIEFLHDESIAMINIWLKHFLHSLDQEKLPFSQAFNANRPILREKHLHSEQHNVKGFVDAIFSRDNEITILDYKTSKKAEITADIKLQLAIYALLFYETYGRVPKKVGAFFLKLGQIFLDVDEDLLKLAKLECEVMQENTKSEIIADYPCKITPLCKWSTGQCDHYDLCITQRDGHHQ